MMPTVLKFQVTILDQMWLAGVKLKMKLNSATLVLGLFLSLAKRQTTPTSKINLKPKLINGYGIASGNKIG